MLEKIPETLEHSAPRLILVVDDEARMIRFIRMNLELEGYQVIEAGNGVEALEQVRQHVPDLIVMDVMMPELDGFEVLRHIRKKSDIPVVMLTARGDETDRIVGLEMGADDYLPKPFNPRELLARLKAVLRRSNQVDVASVLHVHDLAIDTGARTVTRGDQVVDLTGIEFDLLVAMVRRAVRVVTRAGLLDGAGRGDVVVSDRTVDVHISHLRQKLERQPKTPTLIKTVRGVGYVFTKDDQTGQ